MPNLDEIERITSTLYSQIVEEAKKLLNKLNWSYFDMSEEASDEYVDAVQTVLSELEKKDKEYEELLKAYKELKEIEESHRKENGELRKKVKELEEWNKTLNERR